MQPFAEIEWLVTLAELNEMLLHELDIFVDVGFVFDDAGE